MALAFNGRGGGGGGSMPVGCLLGIDNGIDLAAASITPLLWDVLYDSWKFANTLNAIPAGLGLSFVFNGTDATITATADGLWAFTLELPFPPDATFSATVRLAQSIADQYGASLATGAANHCVGAVLPLKSGESIAPEVDTVVNATGATLTAYPYMQIVRLG